MTGFGGVSRHLVDTLAHSPIRDPTPPPPLRPAPVGLDPLPSHGGGYTWSAPSGEPTSLLPRRGDGGSGAPLLVWQVPVPTPDRKCGIMAQPCTGGVVRVTAVERALVNLLDQPSEAATAGFGPTWARFPRPPGWYLSSAGRGRTPGPPGVAGTALPKGQRQGGQALLSTPDFGHERSTQRSVPLRQREEIQALPWESGSEPTLLRRGRLAQASRRPGRLPHHHAPLRSEGIRKYGSGRGVGRIPSLGGR